VFWLAGFLLSNGQNLDRIIVRGLGPSLPGSLGPLLADPTLELRDSEGTLVDILGNPSCKARQSAANSVIPLS